MRKNQQARLKSSPRRPRKGECSATPSAKSQQYYDTAQTRLGPQRLHNDCIGLCESFQGSCQSSCYHPRLPNQLPPQNSQRLIIIPRPESFAWEDSVTEKSPGASPEQESEIDHSVLDRVP